MDYMQYRPDMGLQTPEERQMSMFIHLSQLAGLVIPVAGLVLPIVLWQTQKDKMRGVDAHGKMVTNWIISSIIYLIISGILSIIIVGLLGVFAVIIMSIVFPIVGGVKASNGEFWEYPLTIKFLK